MPGYDEREATVTLPLGTPEALGAHVKAEYKKWGEVVRKANITLPQ